MLQVITKQLSLFKTDVDKWMTRLEGQLNEATNQNSLKVPKVVRPMNKKMLS